jgi:hypothetical protein
MSNKFKVVARDHAAAVEISDDARRAAAQYKSNKIEATGITIGGKLWEAMRAAGLNQEKDNVNHFAIYQEDEGGTLIATIHPVLEGAHAMWMVLYRADKKASAFRPLGSRHRVSDALDAAFTKLSQELIMPHKP